MVKTMPWISSVCPLYLNCTSTLCRSNLSSRVFHPLHLPTSVFKIWYSSYLVLSGSRNRSIFTCSLPLEKWSPYFLVSSLQIRSLRKRSFLSDMVLPLLSMRLNAICTCGCSLSKCRPMMYCVSLITIRSIYSRAICAMTALFSRGASSLEKLNVICPTVFATFGFICAWPINPCAIVSLFSRNKPSASMIWVPFSLFSM